MDERVEEEGEGEGDGGAFERESLKETVRGFSFWLWGGGRLGLAEGWGAVVGTIQVGVWTEGLFSASGSIQIPSCSCI